MRDRQPSLGWLTASAPRALLAVIVVATAVSWGWSQNSTPTSAPVTLQRFAEMDIPREKGQRASDIVNAMAISTGDWVADVGAGNGYYSQRLSEAVGSTGKVFAEEISDYMLDFLHQRVKLFDLKNVEVVKGDAGDPKLPASSLAAVLIVDSYHHFAQPQTMTKQILQSLKPGGRLVIADYSLSEHRQAARPDQLKMHEIAPALVQTELEETGFQVVKSESPFVKRIPDLKDSSTSRADLWLMVAIRPVARQQ